MNDKRECRLLLAKFFEYTKKIRAHWFLIISEENGSSSSSSSKQTNNAFALHHLLGLDYNDMYIPFMKKCGLIHTMKHNRSGAMIDVPSINIGHFNKSGYTWNDFLAEHKLYDSIEVAYFCSSQSGKKSYYVKVGSSGNSHYTIADQ